MCADFVWSGRVDRRVEDLSWLSNLQFSKYLLLKCVNYLLEWFDLISEHLYIVLKMCIRKVSILWWGHISHALLRWHLLLVKLCSLMRVCLQKEWLLATLVIWKTRRHHLVFWGWEWLLRHIEITAIIKHILFLSHLIGHSLMILLGELTLARLPLRWLIW